MGKRRYNNRYTRAMRTARALIEQPWGWIRGARHRFNRRTVGYCLLGGIDKGWEEETGIRRLHPATGDGPLVQALTQAIFEQTGQHLSIPSFNDNGRKKRDILKAIARASEILESQPLSNFVGSE